MDFKTELVASKAEAYDFLERAMKDALQGRFASMRRSVVAPFGADVKVTHSDDSCMYIAMAELPEGSGKLTVTNLRVHPDFKKRKFGPIAFKAALGVVAEAKRDVLYLNGITEAGPSFWSAMGAVPAEMPRDLAAVVREHMAARRTMMKSGDFDGLERIAQIAERNPYQAWRLLSHTDVKCIDEQYFIDPMFLQICEGKDMILLPGEPTTRAMLEQKLGVLPAFRPPASLLLQRIAGQLAASRPAGAEPVHALA